MLPAIAYRIGLLGSARIAMVKAHQQQGASSMGTIARSSSRLVSYPTASAGFASSDLRVQERSPAGPLKPRLLDRVRQAICARRYSRRTE